MSRAQWQDEDGLAGYTGRDLHERWFRDMTENELAEQKSHMVALNVWRTSKLFAHIAEQAKEIERLMDENSQLRESFAAELLNDWRKQLARYREVLGELVARLDQYMNTESGAPAFDRVWHKFDRAIYAARVLAMESAAVMVQRDTGQRKG
jgi:hypothetical protein